MWINRGMLNTPLTAGAVHVFGPKRVAHHAELDVPL